MLVNLTEIMNYAEERGIAIGAFNSPDLEALRGVIDAAEELNLPVILQHAQLHESWIELDLMGPCMVEWAKRAKVPVCVMLDHGEDLDYLKRALDIGFTSIMYDGSKLSYEENLENSKKAVEMAKKYGATVEAELGTMGKREWGDGTVGSGNGDKTKIYTDPDLAAEFVKATGIDALACSFGTTHGVYLEKPKLDFDVVKNVREKTGNIPVVMHGGSGVSAEDFRKAIEAGVRKVNYFTYMDKAAGNAVKAYVEGLEEGKQVFFSSMLKVGRQAYKEDVKRAMMQFALMD